MQTNKQTNKTKQNKKKTKKALPLLFLANQNKYANELFNMCIW